MEQKLYEAAFSEENAKSWKEIKESERASVITCCFKGSSSPLHVAVFRKNLRFLETVLASIPELAEATDSRRRSPLHLASAKGYAEIVNVLVSKNIDLCQARDKEGNNPLHLAAMNGHFGVLKELVDICPGAAEARTDRGSQTILHLCFNFIKQSKNQLERPQFEALKLLLEATKGLELVNAKDDEGSTILHLAAANHNLEMVQDLLECEGIDASPRNVNGETPLDIIFKCEGKLRNKTNTFWHFNNIIEEKYMTSTKNALYKKGAKTGNQLRQKKWLSEKRDSLMVVASLIATMAFQAGVSPPGGVWQDNSDGHRAGETVMAYNYPDSFPYFLRLNTVGLVGSLSIILLLISELPFRKRIFMWVLVVILWVTVTAMAFTYSYSITVVTPKKDRDPLIDTIKYGVVAWCCVMAVLLAVHTGKMIMKLVTQHKRFVYMVCNWFNKLVPSGSFFKTSSANQHQTSV